ncbi:MAG: ABC transporter permease [Myxococcota bacterium]
MMRTVEVTWALCVRELLRFLRERNQLYSALARPLLWLVFLGSGMRGAFRAETGVSYVAFLLPGVVAMTILFGGLFSGVSTVWDRELGFMREMLVAPVSRLGIVGGKLVAGAAVTSVQALVTLAFAPLVGVSFGGGRLAALLGLILLTSLGIVGLALVIAARMRTLEGFGNLANFVALPLFFLSGSMYPLEHVPGWLRPVVAANPVTYAVDAMRQVAVGTPGHPMALDLGVLSGFALLMGAGAVLQFRRDW